MEHIADDAGKNSPSKKEKISIITNRIYKSFSPTEKLVFYVLAIIIVVASVSLFSRLYSKILVEVPTKGGSITEGIIGTPRFINPILANSDADRDLSSVVFAGLMKATPEGEIVPELAESITISENGLVYDFKLKEDIIFHDGQNVTAEDVFFTIEKIKDPIIKSPKRSAWEGVLVEIIDDKNIRFTLTEAYRPFLENTTLGILPSHIWEKIESDQFTFSVYNTDPIGAGPFYIDKIKENSLRTPTEYLLKPFDNYVLGRPFLDKLNFKIFSNEGDLVQAFENNSIDTMGGVNVSVVKEYENNGKKIITADLPRIFGVFFNQSQNDALLNKSIREALNIGLDREAMVNNILKGYGMPVTTPFIKTAEDDKITESIERANQILIDAGWKLNEETGIREKNGSPLSFTLSTSDKTDLRFTAESLKEQWKKIGVDVSINVYNSTDLNQNIIRPRKYEALLFGIVVGREKDVYPFWHSSQRNDPGLNVSLYANINADELLEELRVTPSKERIGEIISELNNIFKKDLPAVFLYSPKYTYIADENIKSIELNEITLPNERFTGIKNWYVDTNRILNFLK